MDCQIAIRKMWRHFIFFSLKRREMSSINCFRTAKAPLHTFASVSRFRYSPNPIVSVLRRKSSPSFVTLRVVSSMAYEKELDAAKKAASLAARLCQVSFSWFNHDPDSKVWFFSKTHFVIFPISIRISLKECVFILFGLFQKVQKALLQSDVQSKSDKSPVTVADYG